MSAQTIKRLKRFYVLAFAVLTALLPLAGVGAAGSDWLPVMKITNISPASLFSPLLHPSIAINGNVYVLSTQCKVACRQGSGGENPTEVYLTKGVPAGAPGMYNWSTSLVSFHGPDYYRGQEGATSLAVDPATGYLYAAWVYQLSQTGLNPDAIGLWTSRDEGRTWQRLTNIAEGVFTPPSLVVWNHTVYVAFAGAPTSSCPGTPVTGRVTDILIASYDGGASSTPQDLTSCVSAALVSGFQGVKLAADESGKLYVVASALASSGGPLWYMDDTGGTWSKLEQIPHAQSVFLAVSHAAKYDYSIAASDGIAYVAYVQYAGPSSHGPGYDGYHDVYLSARSAGGGWAQEQLPQDPANCNKFDVSLAAHDGRVGMAYTLGSTGYCVSSGSAYNVTHVLTGTPGNWTEGLLTLPTADTSCTRPALASDGSLFGLVMSCGQGPGAESGNLYYTDRSGGVGPIITQLTESIGARQPTVNVHWSPPPPANGRYAYTVQVSGGAAPAQGAPGTFQQSRSYTYRAFQIGITYTFKVCAYGNPGHTLIGCASRSVLVS